MSRRYKDDSSGTVVSGPWLTYPGTLSRRASTQQQQTQTLNLAYIHLPWKPEGVNRQSRMIKVISNPVLSSEVGPYSVKFVRIPWYEMNPSPTGLILIRCCTGRALPPPSVNTSSIDVSDGW
jgi:hypothetical protein